MLLLQTTCVICGSQNNKKSAREDAKHLTEVCIAVLKVLCQLHQALATGQLLEAPSDSEELNRLISLSALKGTVLVSGHLNCYIKSVPHNALDYLYSILRGSLLRCQAPDAQELLHILWSSCKKKQLGFAAAQVLAHIIDALYKTDMVVSISLVTMVLHDLQQVLARSDPASQDAADSIEMCTNVLLLVAAAQDCGAFSLVFVDVSDHGGRSSSWLWSVCFAGNMTVRLPPCRSCWLSCVILAQLAGVMQ